MHKDEKMTVSVEAFRRLLLSIFAFSFINTMNSILFLFLDEKFKPILWCFQIVTTSIFITLMAFTIKAQKESRENSSPGEIGFKRF
jgi:hypothetical protein